MADDTKLTGKELDERAAELDIEGRSDMTADEKRAAIADAEAEGDAPAAVRDVLAEGDRRDFPPPIVTKN